MILGKSLKLHGGQFYRHRVSIRVKLMIFRGSPTVGLGGNVNGKCWHPVHYSKVLGAGAASDKEGCASYQGHELVCSRFGDKIQYGERVTELLRDGISGLTPDLISDEDQRCLRLGKEFVKQCHPMGDRPFFGRVTGSELEHGV